jgi:hypothetical protein
MLRQYGRVRVKQVNQPGVDDDDDWKANRRQPQVGDIGTIVDIVSAPSMPVQYVVESVESREGIAIWLCEFLAEDIEMI